MLASRFAEACAQDSVCAGRASWLAAIQCGGDLRTLLHRGHHDVTRVVVDRELQEAGDDQGEQAASASTAMTAATIAYSTVDCATRGPLFTSQRAAARMRAAAASPTAVL